MREKIEALVGELKRRKVAGETHVHVSRESIDKLRVAAKARPGLRSRPSRSDEAARSPEQVPEPVEAVPIVGEAAPAAPRKVQSMPTLLAGATGPEAVFTLPDGTKRERWEWLRQRVLSCPVCNANLNAGGRVVFGDGNIDSPIFFCGEAPGGEEEEQGIPFVGKAGQLLVKIIQAMGLSREQVYIGNIMNWRPQTGSLVGNRPPTDEEMRYCLPYLRAQVQVVQPRVIVALGNTAFKGLLGPTVPGITSARGRWFDFEGIALMPTFHPSYLLRYGSMEKKRQAWEDMLMVMEKVGMPISERQRGFFMPKAGE
jgi:DNA polymerase